MQQLCIMVMDNVNRMHVGVNCATQRDKGYAGCAHRSG